MPPQPGIFALPYGTTHSQSGALASTSSQGGAYRHPSNSTTQLQQQQHLQQHPSSSSHHTQHSSLGHGHPPSHLHHNFHQHGGAVGDTRKDSRKRKDVSGKLGKEMGDRRDELSFFFLSFFLFLFSPFVSSSLKRFHDSRSFSQINFFYYNFLRLFVTSYLTPPFLSFILVVAISPRAFRHYIILPTS